MPGGWNRLHLRVNDLAAEVARLRAQGVSFRTEEIPCNSTSRRAPGRFHRDEELCSAARHRIGSSEPGRSTISLPDFEGGYDRTAGGLHVTRLAPIMPPIHTDFSVRHPMRMLVGLTAILAACSDPAGVRLSSRAPDYEGTITLREQFRSGAEIRVQRVPGPIDCRIGLNGALHYYINPRTFVVERLSESGSQIRRVSPDSLLVDTRVRVWHGDLPTLDSCPPIVSLGVIEIVR